MPSSNSLAAYSATASGVTTDVVVAGMIEPTLTLAAQFTAAAAAAAIAPPCPVRAVQVTTFVTGSPTTASVVVEGSNDGATWTALPSADPQAVYAQLRLHCTALTGGTTPTVTAVAVASQ